MVRDALYGGEDKDHAAPGVPPIEETDLQQYAPEMSQDSRQDSAARRFAVSGVPAAALRGAARFSNQGDLAAHALRAGRLFNLRSI
jgi:hypothetical protein